MSFESALSQWREGERLLGAVDPDHVRTLDRVVTRVVAELRHRLGGPFTVDELVALYEQGTGWCLDLAYATAPGAPWAWNERIIADAAFARYLREARDFAGGRRIER